MLQRYAIMWFFLTDIHFMQFSYDKSFYSSRFKKISKAVAILEKLSMHLQSLLSPAGSVGTRWGVCYQQVTLLWGCCMSGQSYGNPHPLPLTQPEAPCCLPGTPVKKKKSRNNIKWHFYMTVDTWGCLSLRRFIDKGVFPRCRAFIWVNRLASSCLSLPQQIYYNTLHLES